MWVEGEVVGDNQIVERFYCQMTNLIQRNPISLKNLCVLGHVDVGSLEI